MLVPLLTVRLASFGLLFARAAWDWNPSRLDRCVQLHQRH